MKLLFARQLSFFLVTVYVPCSMTVSVSWLSFWLDHNDRVYDMLYDIKEKYEDDHEEGNIGRTAYDRIAKTICHC